MSVTVAIPTTGVRPVLRQCAEAALRSASLVSPDAEVLVVVNGRDDAPGLGRVDSPLVRVVYREVPSLPAARNHALAIARHDVLLFADDDVLVPESWCPRLHAALRDEGAAVATVPVRVPVCGPVTAFADYQRKYDSQPPRPDDPGTLFGANFGLRRDLLPAGLRFDENFTVAGEDADFSYQIWSAGITFRLLSDTTPVQHELPEGIEPVLERSLRYGHGTVLSLTKRGFGARLLPAFAPWYQTVTSQDYDRSCRYAEVVWPDVREAFRVYAAVFNFGYLVGVLRALGTSLGRPVVRLDEDRMLDALRAAAARAADRVAGRTQADWQHLPLDYSRLGGGHELRDPFAESVIAELKSALRQHAPLAPDVPLPAARPGPGGSGGPGPGDPAGRNGQAGQNQQPGQDGQPGRSGHGGPGRGRGAAQAWATELVGPATRALVRQVLDELKARPCRPISKADLDSFAQTAGLPFRVCCELVEREFYQLT